MNLLDFSVERALKTLENKGIILYPTDTIWGLGCDATNGEVVQKIFRIKKRVESKSFILLVSDFQMLTSFVTIPLQVIDFLKKQQRPTSVIYQNPSGLAHNVVASDNSVAIRVVQDDFCQKLIQKFGKPIVSTSANFSGFPSPQTFTEIDSEIKKLVDYIVDYKQDNQEIGMASQLVKLSAEGEIIFLRK